MGADIKMNCFSHDDNHWRTPPLWTEGSFCACTNSNNNTYWCTRNINQTHNYLYCEYVTGMITYSDLNQDKHQLRNLLYSLTDSQLSYLNRKMEAECRKDKYQLPCLKDQNWVCRREKNGSWKIKQCQRKKDPLPSRRRS